MSAATFADADPERRGVQKFSRTALGAHRAVERGAFGVIRPLGGASRGRPRQRSPGENLEVHLRARLLRLGGSNRRLQPARRVPSLAVAAPRGGERAGVAERLEEALGGEFGVHVARDLVASRRARRQRFVEVCVFTREPIRSRGGVVRAHRAEKRGVVEQRRQPGESRRTRGGVRAPRELVHPAGLRPEPGDGVVQRALEPKIRTLGSNHRLGATQHVVQQRNQHAQRPRVPGVHVRVQKALTDLMEGVVRRPHAADLRLAIQDALGERAHVPGGRRRALLRRRQRRHHRVHRRGGARRD